MATNKKTVNDVVQYYSAMDTQMKLMSIEMERLKLTEKRFQALTSILHYAETQDVCTQAVVIQVRMSKMMRLKYSNIRELVLNSDWAKIE